MEKCVSLLSHMNISSSPCLPASLPPSLPPSLPHPPSLPPTLPPSLSPTLSQSFYTPRSHHSIPLQVSFLSTFNSSISLLYFLSQTFLSFSFLSPFSHTQVNTHKPMHTCLKHTHYAYMDTHNLYTHTYIHMQACIINGLIPNNCCPAALSLSSQDCSLITSANQTTCHVITYSQ